MARRNLVQALTSMAMTNIRSVIGALDLDGALSGREEINSRLLETLDHATDPWGVKVSRVELRKIEPPANLVVAMNMQMTAERERRATVARANGEREAEIARAEGAKQAKVLEAEGRLAAALKDAEARVALCRGRGEGDVGRGARRRGHWRRSVALFRGDQICRRAGGARRQPVRPHPGDPDRERGPRRRHRQGARAAMQLNGPAP